MKVPFCVVTNDFVAFRQPDGTPSTTKVCVLQSQLLNHCYPHTHIRTQWEIRRQWRHFYTAFQTLSVSTKCQYRDCDFCVDWRPRAVSHQIKELCVPPSFTSATASPRIVLMRLCRTRSFYRRLGARAWTTRSRRPFEKAAHDFCSGANKNLSSPTRNFLRPKHTHTRTRYVELQTKFHPHKNRTEREGWRTSEVRCTLLCML